MAITILATDLAEFAGPIGENTGKTGVRQAGARGAAAAIESAANSPAAVDAGFRIGIEAQSMLSLESGQRDRKSTRLNSTHQIISLALLSLKKKNKTSHPSRELR